ncbi:MAG: AgmX/PglI C-terminal domain-containing protein [Myxococcales bacterium]|nr:AgmX/PglI C-terminal domain-containing protein [Myxococcales bacterium]
MRRCRWMAAGFVVFASLACGGLPMVGADETLCASQTFVTPTVDLVELDGPTPTIEPGVLVELTTEGFRVDGEDVSSPADALSGARQQIRDLRSSGAELSDALLVAIAPDVPGEQVVQALDLARKAGVPRIRFLARSPGTREPVAYVDPDYAADLESRLAEVDPDMRTTVAARELDSLLTLCPSGKRVLTAAANASFDTRCRLVVAGMEEALPSCPLTSKDKVATVIQVAFQPPPFTLVALDLELTEDAEPFDVQPDARWSEVAAAWLPRTGTAATWRLPGTPDSAEAAPRGVRDTPRPKATPAPARAGSVTVTGGLDKAIVSRVLARSRAGMRACYEQALSRNPSASGSIEVRITVGPSGSVSSATTAADTIGDPALASCLVSGAKRMTFPEPQGGSATIVVPLVFAPAP